MFSSSPGLLILCQSAMLFTYDPYACDEDTKRILQANVDET